MPPFNRNQIEDILQAIKYLDWRWRVLDKGDGFLIQLAFTAPDCHSGTVKEHHSRKWYVSSHACISEIVETAWAAVQRAVLHEAAENFTYQGRRVYNPHFHVGGRMYLDGEHYEDSRDGT
jgi:hypothetical protein